MSSQLISEFDLWRYGYENAVVTVYIAGTTTPASLFSDVGLTQALSNPQTLLSDGEGSGKFAQSVYVGVSYELDIDTNETSGQEQLPITALPGLDASQMLVTVDGSSQANTLDSVILRRVDAQNYGILEFGNNAGDAATNTATINAAIGACGSGGIVVLPSGIIRVLQMTIPANVVLQGQGKGVTTLMSILGEASFLLAGAGGGFRNLTIDGNILSANSIGVYGVAMNSIVFDHVNIQNFQIGLYLKGGTENYWNNLDVMNCTTGAKLVGDSDAGNTNSGTAFTWNVWNGGHIYACGTTGLYFGYKDRVGSQFTMRDVFFDSNITNAIQINGGQFIEFKNCNWAGNACNFTAADDTTVLTGAANINNNLVIDVLFDGGSMNGGTWTMTGTAQAVKMRGIEIVGVAFTMGTPLLSNIIFEDCYEDSTTTVSGQATKLLTDKSTNHGYTTGITTGNVATTAWSLPMVSGQVAHVRAQIIAKQTNGTNVAMFDISCGAYVTPGSLAYVLQTAHFVLGDILTGATSGATARIVSATNSGTTGTITLVNIQGTFLTGEIITGSSAGSATANGGVTAGTVTIDGTGVSALHTYHSDTAYVVGLVAGVSEIDLQVTGDTAHTVNWSVYVDVVSS